MINDTTPTIANPLLKPLTIGGITIDPPLILAPMAGFTNYAFRALCRELGGVGLVCTGLLSSMAMQHKSSFEKTKRMFDWAEDESPFAVQIFGTDPHIMADAARIVADYGAEIVDINMGCCVPKAVRRGYGAVLMKDVPLAAAIVEAVVKAVDIPVTVKTRTGWEEGFPTAVDFARRAEDAGAQAIAIHARYASQAFRGEADWDVIRQVKETVSTTPIIGNGDVSSADDAARMFAETGCDAVMIGRAAMGNPWLFRDVAHKLREGDSLPPITNRERAEVMMQHARLSLETSQKSHRIAVHELRGQLACYCMGLPDATTLRAGIVSANSLAEIEAAVAPIAELGEGDFLT